MTTVSSPVTVFQSLAGFLDRCDDGLKSGIEKVSDMFQSLAGFLDRCDLQTAVIDFATADTVSIPGGFS